MTQFNFNLNKNAYACFFYASRVKMNKSILLSIRIDDACFLFIFYRNLRQVIEIYGRVTEGTKILEISKDCNQWIKIRQGKYTYTT